MSLATEEQRAKRNAYVRAWRAANPDKIAATRKRGAAKRDIWYVENRDILLEKRRAFRLANPENIKDQERRKYEKHKSKMIARNKLRKAAKINATPKWLTPCQIQEMQQLYIKAERMTRETGVEHAVDHFYPLRGKTVCGLHVPWNLSVIPATENNQKNNKHPEDFYGDAFQDKLNGTKPTLH